VDLAEVVRWFRAAAAQGHTRAASSLAFCLYHGGEGMAPDYVQAAGRCTLTPPDP
jgi:TPR repeat protein